MALVAYGSSGSSGEESGGEESRETLPTREKDQKSILAVVGPSIGSGKKGKGNVVKIGLPTLVRQDDSDDEESEPQVKKPKLVQEGRSGLSSILPSPKSGFGTKSTRATASIDTAGSQLKHSIAAIGEGASSQPVRRTTALVPHSVSKKQKQRETSKKKDDAGSSDEDDTVPFFSHLSSTATVTASEEERAASTVLPAVHQPTSVQEAAPSGDLTGYTLNDSHRSHGYVSLNEPAPSLWYTSSQAYTSYPDPASEYAPQHYQYSYQQRDQNAPGCSQQGDTPVHVDGGVSAGHEPELDNESLKRLMGGRNWKHKKESVTLLDLNEEQIAQSGQHMRLTHSTEEMDALALASKSQKSVSSTEKRKHQITFLAAEAKARELQLKNQWAQNRMTRRQTQMKYGF